MDFCFSSGGLDLCGAISRICFLWLPIYCFGFPDNLFSNRICIPATISNFWHNTGSWWRRLLAAEPGSLLEINGHCFGFCPIARPHCLFWRVSTRPGDTGHRQAINCTDSQFHQVAEIEQNHFLLRIFQIWLGWRLLFHWVSFLWMWLVRLGVGQGGWEWAPL